MTSTLAHTLRTTACAFLVGSLTAGAAQATEGYFQEGVSVQEKATGGAGVANPRDALTIANNPAGLVDVGAQANLDLTFFAPDRGYDASGTLFVAPGSHTSHDNVFPVPAMAFAMPIDATSAFGIAMYGNGGMNTHYVTSAAAPFCAPGTGVFCGGSQTGVNLTQAFMSVGYAKKFGSFSVGIAPIFAMQMFSAYGLGAFGGISSNPAELSGNGTDWSFGGGLRVGAEWHVTPALRFGLAGATPMWMSKLSKYSGLFADGGSFDIPASITAGVAYDVLPMFTVMLDYKRIFYSGVPAISNPSAFVGIPLGASGGPGFGWSDVNVVSVGAEWRMMPNLTLRAGYSHNTNPINAKDVTLNILAPGIVTDHISAGASYALTQNLVIDLAGVVVPRHDISGPEVIPGFGAVPGSNVNLRMSQFEVTAGLTYKFGAPPPPPAPVISKY